MSDYTQDTNQPGGNASMTGNRDSLLSFDSEDTMYADTMYSDTMYSDTSRTNERSGVPTKLGAFMTKRSTLWAWKLEFMMLLVSILAFGSLVAFLVTFDNRGLPDELFLHFINLSTVVTVFSLIIRSTLVFIGAEVIGQARWSWMKKPRPLRDLEHFSNASKGAWGSLKLLLTRCRPTMAALGAVVVLASSLVDVFLQQAAKPELCMVETEGSAGVAYTKWARWTAPNTKFKLYPELQGVALNGMLFGESASNSLRLSQCSSGTCSFDEVAGVTHSSAGFCSKCTDATAALRQSVVAESDATVYHFGDMAGFNLTWPPADGRLFDMLAEDFSTTARAFSSLLAFRPAGCPQSQTNTSDEDWRACLYRAFTNDHGRYARVGNEVDILAVNCTLSPCVRHLSATVKNGSFHETLVFEQPNTNLTYQWEGSESTFSGYTTMVEPCVVNGTWYDRHNISEATRGDMESWTSWGVAPDDVDWREAPTKCVRAIGADMIFGLQTFLNSTFAGSCVVDGGNAPDLGKGGLAPAEGRNKKQLHFSCGDKWLLDRLYDQGRVTFETVSGAYDSMATAINNRLRKDIRPEYGEVLFAEGSVLGPAQCVHPRWLWLTYPGVALLLAAGILVAAYVQSCRERAGQPIWKSTVLPLLFYNVQTAAEGRQSEAATSALTTRELRALADKTQARFDADVGFVVRTSD
ncbi:hypothetical protein CSOJ01_03245 [Colletotrichum sojae]|uniref:Uncharacterized protein n=1 Tax=Colletotrichum sojae TaxID=2175907 RepID=A0A8H6JNJ0_9PEZI|nr:hypothetical protein CSOJ01_03245 [Colletotrichum sojae]